MPDYITRISGLIEKKNALGKQIFSDVMPIDKVMTKEGIRFTEIPYDSRETIFEEPEDWEEFKAGGAWGKPDTHFCFKLKVRIPEIYRGKEVLFFLSTGADDIWNTDNPQMLLYIDGIRRCGMDMNHNSVVIYEKEDWEKGRDRAVDIGIYAYSNLAENENLLNMELAAGNEAVTRAYFDVLVLLEAAEALLGIRKEEELPESFSAEVLEEKIDDRFRFSKKEILDELIAGLEEAFRILGMAGAFDEAVITEKTDILDELAIKASEYLRKNLYGRDYLPVTVASTGHTHIDVAWKWELCQTREKAIRSYATVMELMKRYPEYRFMMSTPQLYEYIREDEPELFEEIKEKVKEGRFEPEGAMWLEADCNLTSGESLVRQILYGKRYFKGAFGIDSDILWLPDVFGYSAAMPQILKKSGVRAFVTTKLAWNDTNRLPHDFFYWEGIDGTKIPTYLITTCDYPLADKAMKTGGLLEYTYNGRQNPSQILGTYRAFREKELTDELLTVYGFGDGGGGPTWEMLEMDRRLEMGVPGCPRTELKSVTAFFDDLLKKLKKPEEIPKISGELYLEYHRGTYTSMAKNKRYNRQLEYLLKEAELICSYGLLAGRLRYPENDLYEIWKVLMLNQFHDILPGSSIKGVYEDSWEQYEDAISDCKGIIRFAYEQATGFDCEFDEDFDEDYEADFEADAEDGPVEALKQGQKTELETPFYKVVFDENGEIESLFDKELGREIRDLSQPPLNRLMAFEDKPKDYDAWNIDADFEKTSWNITDLQYIELPEVPKEDAEDFDVAAYVNIERNFRKSVIGQNIIFYKHSKRIDFETDVDWHEHQTLLKAAFPVEVEASNLDCDIQFGNLRRKIKRDTSIEKAKFECCAHRWIDMTADTGEYGVAILNDCKYGYDAKEKLMRLTLIKSGIFPNPDADQGVHLFTYSLLPHRGDFREGLVIEQAEELNAESIGFLPFLQESMARDLAKLREGIIDLGDEKGVYVSAIKKAEDTGAIIIRLYEAHGRSHEVKAQLFKDFEKVEIRNVRACNLLEKTSRVEQDFDRNTGILSFAIAPYEIKTYSITFW